MATIGIKHPVFAPISAFNSGAKPTYDAGFVVCKAIKADLTITTAEGTLYADDAIAEYASKVKGASISFEGDEISDNNRCAMFGYTKVNASGGKSGLKRGALDTPVHGGFGYYKTKTVNNVTMYRAMWFYNAVFTETSDSAETDTENINFQTTTIEGKALPVIGFEKDLIIEEATFSSESEALTWLHTMANISGVATASVASASAPATTSNK